MRLDKLLSSLGYCSRSEVRDLLRDGRVLVEGRDAVKPSDLVEHGQVTFDGIALDPPQGMVIMMNKPCGYTVSRKEQGALIYELFPTRYLLRRPALSAVGRLDKETSGLLLFTDNGKLLHAITSPKRDIGKTYYCEVATPLRGDESKVFASGELLLNDDPTPLKPAIFEQTAMHAGRLTIFEGRYHQVRRMFAAVGNEITLLRRESIGALQLGSLEEGRYTMLEPAQIEKIFEAVQT